MPRLAIEKAIASRLHGTSRAPLAGRQAALGRVLCCAVQPPDAERVWQHLLESNSPGSASGNWKDLSSLNILASARFGSVAGSWSLQRGSQGLCFKIEIAYMVETFKTAAVNLPHPIASINYFIISIKKLDFLSGRQPAEREGKETIPPQIPPSRQGRCRR